ncbi:MAG: hypothetical protein GXP37_14215 [Chloroflexi bacterium]|nr:hypothetical protein [Chloroflexota bacterium]
MARWRGKRAFAIMGERERRSGQRQRPGVLPNPMTTTGIPPLGRFIQPDTIVPNPGDPQSLNRYSYAGNNPVRYSDPSGHMFVQENEANPCPGVIGGSVSYSYNPFDNPTRSRLAHSTIMGPAIGEQVSGNVSLVEYMPIATRHEDGSITVDIDNYLFDPEFGNNRRGPVGLTFRYTPYGMLMEKLWGKFNAQ